MKGFCADRSGTTAIEFAFASTALLLVTFGIIEFSRMIWTQQIIQSAATLAARCVAISSALCPDAAQFAVQVASDRGVPDVQKSGVTVTNSTSCGSTVGTFTEVSIAYTYVAMVPSYIPVPKGAMNASSCFPH